MLIFILTICIVFSGCIEGNNVTKSNESVYQGPVNSTPENLSSTILPREENIPEIEVTSFSSIHMHDNHEKVYDYLFSWDNVPGSENQELVSYLRTEKEKEKKDDLNISWADNSQIVKSDDNKTIRVYFTSSNSTELTPKDHKNKVLITPPNVELELKKVNGKYKVQITPLNVELEGKEVNGKLCIYKVEEKLGYSITERYYAAYGLSIKNNGSNNLDFKLNELHLRDGDKIFDTTNLDPYDFIGRSKLEVLSDLEKENKIGNVTLSPGQTINGSVVFQVNSLYNESFLLMYNLTPITSVSFGKSIEALRTTERYNYSVAFGIPPYRNIDVDSSEPNLEAYPYIFSNWVNRSVFEFFDKVDSEDVLKSSSNDIHRSIIVYALKVIPERNITILPVKTGFNVVDDTGEELINTSEVEKISVLRNEAYKMNLSNATIVRTSFGRFGNLGVGIYCYNNQDIILDNYQNLIVVRHNNFGVHGP